MSVGKKLNNKKEVNEMKKQCMEYQPIGTGECYKCGKPFYYHWTTKNIDKTLLVELDEVTVQ